MSKKLDNIINVLYSQIMGGMQSKYREQCEIYQRSACLKHLFAEKRLKSLAEHIEEYTQKWKSNEVLDRLYIEMDFDHCILSLRSSLEHLAQLINAIIPLNLSPKVTKGQTHVTMQNVIEAIVSNNLLRNDKCLSELSLYLKTETDKDWYNELHALRIESFHQKSGRIPRSSIVTRNHDTIDLTFLLPNGTCSSLKTRTDRDIRNYCKNRVEDVEKVLNTSFNLLSRYLSIRLGNAWLKQL